MNSFSNRCFWTKAISIWTSTGDADHAWIVGAYFHYAGGYEAPVVRNQEYSCFLINPSENQFWNKPNCFQIIYILQSVDISPNPGRSDPMYIVYSRKKAEA